MGKIIKLTEADIFQIVKKVLSEQTESELNPKKLKLGAGGKNNPSQVEDVKKLQQKLMDLGFMKLKSGKPTGYFGTITQNALRRALGKNTTSTPPAKPTTPPKPTTTSTSSFSCPSIRNSPYFRDIKDVDLGPFSFISDQEKLYAQIDKNINENAKYYQTQISTLSEQTACEIASIGVRPKYDNRNVFIIDSPNKMIYLFSEQPTIFGLGGNFRKLIAEDVIIDGKQKQRNDAVSIAKAFVTIGQRYQELKAKLGRDATEDEMWATIDADQTRFLPAGVYTPDRYGIRSNSEYAGTLNNVLGLSNWLGKQTSMAIHGYVLHEPKRVEAMKKALAIVKDPTNLEQIKDFQETVQSGGLNLNFSYGCINVPERFLPYLRDYGPNSFIFNIAEDTENYLVQNSVNFFNKMMTDETCPSPSSLGAEDISLMV